MRHSCFQSSGAKLRQQDGRAPSTVTQAMPSEEYGVFLAETRFSGGAYYQGTTPFHLLVFQLKAANTFSCRVDGRSFEHEKTHGHLTLCPAGVDAEARTETDFDALIIGVAHDCMTIGENPVTRIRHHEGYDANLFHLALTLRDQARRNLPDGPLAWSDAACTLVDNLAGRYALRPTARDGDQQLGAATIQRLRELVLDDPAAPLDLAILARASGCSAFHFARRFRKTVGLTPHRWVMRLRLSRAAEMIADRRCSLADIACATGFADQSHLCRWVRRVYGVPPLRLRQNRRPEGRDAASGRPI
jgi:AraC family transcriptional regulator